MELEKIKNLYKDISCFHKDEVLDAKIEVEGKLKPKLRQYQEKAVKWMLKREYQQLEESYNGIPLIFPLGGILADEMGLGKTVEVLACILSNYCSFEEPELKKVCCKTRADILGIDSDEEDEEYKPKSKRSRRTNEGNKKTPGTGRTSSKREANKSGRGVLYSYLKNHYEKALAEVSCGNADPRSLADDSLGTNEAQNPIQCFCDNNDCNTRSLVKCDDCEIWLHSKCLGIENGCSFGSVKCPRCWSKSPLVPSKATLIITPSSILDQWIQEIQKHVDSSSVKYIVYNGVKGHNYIQPPTLAGYDIVLTSYNVLCSELDFIQTERRRSLRHAKKYYCPTSPLVCLKWWRLCLDEAQMVESFRTKTATMAAHLESFHRWAVTGTPIQKCIRDLFGLVVFLRINGLESESEWLQLEENTAEFHRFLQDLMWRSSKSEVQEELGVPPHNLLTHWLHFSPIEGHFYRTIHTECATAFRKKLFRFGDLDLKLAEINRNELNKLMIPLLGVRQACTHPQVVRGKFIRFKHTMTMEDLMKEMISKAKKDSECALRQLVSVLHGLAAIHIILLEWTEAVQCYREVLQTSIHYEPSLKMDSLQMIHCLHNLAEVLDNHGAGIPPTLRDSQLREEAEKLERNYLQRYDKKLEQMRENLSKLSASIAHQCGSHTLGFTGWWENIVLDSNLDEEDLLNRVKTHLDDNDVPGQQNLSKKLHSLGTLHRELAVWLANADSLRVETMESMRKLEISPKNQLIETAFSCHMSNNKKKKKVKKSNSCSICVTESLLKKYEAHIFSINIMNLNRPERLRPLKRFESEDSNDEQEVEKKTDKKLKSVNVYTTNKESSWKPTDQERCLHVLANVAKRVSSTLAEQGAQHLALLESVRKEFKWIRAVWRSISDQLYAIDELHMAKLRLRLPLYEGEPAENSIFIIEAPDVPVTQLQLKADYVQSESLLRKTTGTLYYLQNLKESGTMEQECPVCKEPLTNKWSVLTCGHCCCYECIPTLLKMSGSMIDCPLCRVKTAHESVSYVVQAQKSDADSSAPEIVGDHSTKVTAVISKLQSLIKEDPTVKVLIFSSWEKVLDIIRDALIQNGILFRRLETSSDKFKLNLSQFKNGSISVLLLPLKQGSKGLNLTEASHLFFVEPVLNPAEEQQAVGRIHRIGQTKETWVHRFVVCNSIEERMLTSLEASGSEAWAKENVTLRKLNDLFLLSDDAQNSH